MPSAYAHYRFGDQALPTLPGDIRGPLQRYRRLYDLGLQGPDFFFYYKLGKDTPIRHLASSYHHRTGAEVFEKICRELKNPSEEEQAYLYGLLGHYCLDAHCHPLVHQVTGEDGRAHNAMESEFDRYLLAESGVKKPHGYNRGIHLKCGTGCGSIIARFYPEAKPEQIAEGINTMAAVLGLLTIHPAAGQVLKLMGGDNPGLLMHKKPDPTHCRWNGPLLERYNEALEKYPDYLEQLYAHMTFGEAFGKEFDEIFG